MPGLNALAQMTRQGSETSETSETYDQTVHFVHLYVIEPHPISPDVSPYRGDVWETEYSTLGQPVDLAERNLNAAAMEVLLEGEQLLLVDDLTPAGRVNPVWCTYGPAPNAAFLIGQDGIVAAQQDWLDVDAMHTAIDALLE